MHELKITMLGPRGVGKTSLLAAMYEQFGAAVGTTDLQLTPDLESSAVLQDRLAELKSMFDGGIEALGGVAPTAVAAAGAQALRSFRFTLGKKGARATLEIHFRDYPGGYHFSTATPEQRRFVHDLVSECAAVVVAVDGPALVEEEGRWHQKLNRPQQVTDLFRAGYQDLESPRLVIFAPVKCERYLRSREEALALEARVRDGYAQLLELFRSPALRSHVAVVVAPVQTLGNVIFSRIEMVQGEPEFCFRKTGRDARYNPRDSDQPLRYLLRFLLRLHMAERSWGSLNFLRDWLGRDEHLKHAVRSFAAGCKSDAGFAVLQGAEWLRY